MGDYHRSSAVSGGRPSSSMLGSLRNMQIIESKPILPAEIFSTILDYLPASDMIRCARASKRIRDMVYDDDRWVRRLQRMDCWNEAAARAAKAASPMSPKRKSTGNQRLGRSSSTSTKVNGGTPSLVLSGVSAQSGNTVLPPDSLISPSDGFSAASFSPTSTGLENEFTTLAVDPTDPLYMLQNSRSVRGKARQEFGRLYAVYGPLYKDAVRAKNPSNAKIFRVYRDPKQQAQMLNQIVRFAKSDTPLGQAERDEKLVSVIQAFEEAVSSEFQEGIRTEDYDGRMKKYAGVQVVLNGGQKAIDLFLDNNPLFQRADQFGDPSDCVSPNDPTALFDKEIHNTFYHLLSGSNNQISIARRVFPPSIDIVGPLLQRVARNIIRPYSDKLFDLAHQRSTEAYLRAVAGTFAEIAQFSKSLRLPSASQAALLAQFESIIAEVFSAHFENYLSAEQAFFKRRVEAEVTGWERQLSQQDSSLESLYMANVNRQADKRDFMTSFKEVMMMPVSIFQFSSAKSTGPSTPSAGEAAEKSLNSISVEPSRSSSPLGFLSPARPVSPRNEAPDTVLAAKAAIMKSRLEGISSLFSLEVALSLVHMAKTSIERIAVFTLVGDRFGEDARHRCQVIFNELLNSVGTRHVQVGFDKAVNHLAAYNPRLAPARTESQAQVVAPLAMFLELVSVGDLIQQMLDVFYQQELVAKKLTDKNDFLNPTLKSKKRFEQMLDERVAAGLSKGIEVLLVEVEYQFATTQKTEDYNPDATGEATGMVVEIGTTHTATSVVELLSNHTNMLVGSTDKQLLDVFNQEVGVRLYTAFCKHLKRQRISVPGSLRLISDINHYSAFIKTFKNKNLMDYYNALRELSQIYLIGPENAKELATVIADTDRFRGIMRPEEVYEFAERRADWYHIRGRVEKAMYGAGCVAM